MKKNNIVLFGIAVLCACSVPKERQPLTGGQWGEIKNGSAEEVVSSEVLYWQAPPCQ
jgi:alpha-N-arabinofuranosidase